MAAIAPVTSGAIGADQVPQLRSVQPVTEDMVNVESAIATAQRTLRA